MTDSNSSSAVSEAAPDVIPFKDYFFPRWARNADWRDKLAKKSAYMAMDIADEDEMKILVDKSTNTYNEKPNPIPQNGGMSGLMKGLIGAGIGAAVPGGALLWPLVQGMFDSGEQTPLPVPQGQAITNTEKNVIEFYVKDENGNTQLITVPRLQNDSTQPQ